MNKFLDTNLTQDQFLSGLSKLKKELPNLLEDWESIDLDLKEEYLEQIDWLLEKSIEMISKG